MKSMIRIVIACAAVAAVTATAFAALSAKYEEFGKGPAQWIMTKDEVTKWRLIRTDEEAQAFIDLFWARRDPTPGTPVNEFRDDFDQRVKYAEEHFAEARTKGSMTDRGRVFIVLGAPSRPVQRTSTEPKGTIQTPRASTPSSVGGASPLDDPNGPSVQNYSPKQLWTYEKEKVRFDVGAPFAEVPFVDQYGSNEWKMERTGRTDVNSLLQRVILQAIVNPNLKEAPKVQIGLAQPKAASAAAATAATPAIGAYKTEALKAAVEAFKSAKTGTYKDAIVSYTEMVSPAGDYFVPVQLYIPKDAGVAANAVTTFFGTVEDESGKAVAIYEEPATLATSSGDLYFDKSLNVPPGKYKATLGLAAGGTPVILSSSTLDLKAMDKETFGISKLVIGTDTHQIETAAPPGTPYTFGKLKIVPKGDKIFSNKDEIFYFVEVTNPGIDAATNLPKVQVKLTLDGTVAGKAIPSVQGALTETDAAPLSGAAGPGQYAIIGSIPLGQMTNPLGAGDYTLKLKLIDTVKKQTFNVEQSFKMVAGK